MLTYIILGISLFFWIAFPFALATIIPQFSVMWAFIALVGISASVAVFNRIEEKK